MNHFLRSVTLRYLLGSVISFIVLSCKSPDTPLDGLDTAETLYIGSNKMYALNATNGIKKWEFAIGNAYASTPAVVNGIVYTGSYDNKLYALDTQTGVKKWGFTTTHFVRACPTIVDGVVYVGDLYRKVMLLMQIRVL